MNVLKSFRPDRIIKVENVSIGRTEFSYRYYKKQILTLNVIEYEYYFIWIVFEYKSGFSIKYSIINLFP